MHDAPDLVGEIITSPSAQNILDRYVTRGFYDRSRVALAMFEAIGLEWDDVRAGIATLEDERFPWRATWALPVWEWLYGIDTDEALSRKHRRAQLFARISNHPPINPMRIETALSNALDGLPVTITENVAPHTFAVDIDMGTSNPDVAAALRFLRKIKPSHLSFKATMHMPRTHLLNPRRFRLTCTTLGPFCLRNVTRPWPLWGDGLIWGGDHVWGTVSGGAMLRLTGATVRLAFANPSAFSLRSKDGAMPLGASNPNRFSLVYAKEVVKPVLWNTGNTWGDGLKWREVTHRHL